MKIYKGDSYGKKNMNTNLLKSSDFIKVLKDSQITMKLPQTNIILPQVDLSNLVKIDQSRKEKELKKEQTDQEVINLLKELLNQAKEKPELAHQVNMIINESKINNIEVDVSSNSPKFGEKNKFKGNVEVSQNKTTLSTTKECKNKNFAEKHPWITGLITSLIVGFILLFSFWDKIRKYIEGLFS